MAQDPYKYFRIEARELVADLGKGVLELERTADAAVVAKLLRAAHTLKGAARIVKHKQLAELAHAMEDALAPLREHPIAQRHDAALALIDRMTAQLETLGDVAQAAPIPTAPIAEPPAALPIRRLDTDALDEALGGLATVHALVGRLRAGFDRETAPQLLDKIDRGLREVRRDVEQVRMPAIGSLFVGLERTVRDTALAAGKQAAFSGTGGAVRLDSKVLLALQDALIQLVRNAVVHGIETPTQRRAIGKPEGGRIAIDVRSLGRRIAVSCEDDGGGLDLEAIRRIARARGIEHVEDPGELFQVLLRGGISTTRQVTQLSGRGVGLDVVREVVQGLGGEVTATSSPRGTVITVVVPVSVAAIPIIEIGVGNRVVGIPQSAVRRIARLREADLVRSPTGDAICFDDVTVPCAPLASAIGGHGDHGGTVVFVDGRHGIAALTVERVIGIEEAVVHAVPSAPIDPIVMGMVLDPEGLPYSVLEPGALVEAAQRAGPPRTAKPAPNIRVLVVDDSLTTRMLEQSILESAGFDVSVAESAEIGLARLAKEPFALVLVDVEMPGMDGFAMITEMRSRSTLAGIPAIMVTSRDAPADRRRGELVGAQGYVIKSEFDQIALLALIRKLVTA